MFSYIYHRKNALLLILGAFLYVFLDYFFMKYFVTFIALHSVFCLCFIRLIRFEVFNDSCRTGSSMFEQVFFSWNFFIANITIVFCNVLMPLFIAAIVVNIASHSIHLYNIALWMLSMCLLKIKLDAKHFSQVEQKISFLFLQVWFLNLVSFSKYSLPFPQYSHKSILFMMQTK